MFNTYGNVTACDWLKSDGSLLYTKARLPPEVEAAKRAYIVRPISSGGSSGFKVSGSGMGTMSLSSTDVKRMEGMVIGKNAQGIPIIMGAPTSMPVDKKGVVTTLSCPITTPAALAVIGGGLPRTLSSGPTPAPMGFWTPALVIAVAVIAATTAGVVAFFASGGLGTLANLEAIKEQTNLRSQALQTASEATKIQSEYDSGGYHYIAYNNGELVRIGPDGQVETVKEGVDTQELIDTIIETPYTLPSVPADTLKWVAVIVGVAVVGGIAYVLVKRKDEKGYYLYPGTFQQQVKKMTS